MTFHSEAAEVAGTEPRERTIAFSQMVAGIRRHLWLVAAVFIAVVGITMWYTLRLPRLYRASTSVRIQETLSPIPGMAQAVVRDYRVNPIQTEQQIIQSYSVAERVARELGLQLAIESPSDLRWSRVFGDLPPTVDSTAARHDLAVRLGRNDYRLVVDGREVARAAYGAPVSGGGVTFAVPSRLSVEGDEIRLAVLSLRAAASRVRGGVETEAVPETNIIEISYTGTDPILARNIADGVADAYAEFSTEAKRLQAQQRTGFIQQSLIEKQQELLAAQNRVKEFKEREQLADVSAEVKALTESIQRFQNEKNAALVEQRVYMSLLGKLSAADTSTEELRSLASTDAVQKNQYIANLYDRWFDLLRKRQELMSTGRYSEEADDVKSIDAAIRDVKEDLGTASGNYLQSLRSRLASLDSTIQSLRRSTEKYPSLEATEARLLADLRSVQQTYDQLQAEYQRARISESGDEGYVRVIDRASLPVSPVAPNRTRILLAAALLGLLFGIGIAIWVDTMDDSIRTPEELRQIADLAVLGTIPSIGERKTADESRLATHLDPRSPVAESYRSLRTNLSFARAHRALRVIVFTSPGPADGKSTTVANLAITFAQQGQRTLVVDGDLRRAVLDKLFEVPRAPGVTEVLTGQRKLEDVISPTKIPNLFVLGSGPFPPNPSELLGSNAMRDLLHQASEHFDVVLIDTPPLLAVTDAAVLSTMADGVVVVVRMGSTARPALRRAVAQLEAVEGRLVGVVLNDVDVRRGGYYQSNYGYYYYYYHADGDRNGRHGVINRIRRLITPAGRSS